MFTSHPSGGDGWSSLQYSANNGETAFSFMNSDLPELGFPGTADEVRYALAGSPSDPSLDAVVEHFGKFEPAYPPGPICKISPVSKGIITAFYAKGWNLYEHSKDPQILAKLAMNGPAKFLKRKKDYLIRPVADYSGDLRSINEETAMMNRLGLNPRFSENGAEYVLVAIRLMRGHLELVTEKGAEHNLLMPYWGLRDSIERHISAYTPQMRRG